MRLTFGKFKGEELDDVPISYVRWLEEQEWLEPRLREECQLLIRRVEDDRSSIGMERRR